MSALGKLFLVNHLAICQVYLHAFGLFFNLNNLKRKLTHNHSHFGKEYDNK